MTHIMVDLETMGTAPGSAIVSLGAVVFDPVTGRLGDEFYRVISLRSCTVAGLRIDPDTVGWWMRQSDAARAALTDGDAEDLLRVIAAFAAWWRSQRGRFIWGHGANFDEPLLSSAFRATRTEVPWKYWDARCTRTIFDAAKVKPDRSAGVHHNALDDAKAQAVAVCEAYVKLGLAPAASEVAGA